MMKLDVYEVSGTDEKPNNKFHGKCVTNARHHKTFKRIIKNISTRSIMIYIPHYITLDPIIDNRGSTRNMLK